MKDLTFIAVYHKDGSVFRANAQHEDMLRAAVQKYLGHEPSWGREDASERDELLDFTLIGGNRYFCLVSSIYSWLVSTPEGRRASIEIGLDLNAESTHSASADSIPLAVSQ